jgi:TonB family protein
MDKKVGPANYANRRESRHYNTPILHHSNTHFIPAVETILLLANSETDGSLARAVLEALGTAKAQITWNKALVAQISRFKRYPNAARARGVQGEVSVTFTIDRAGQVITSRILLSSGSTSLDEEALAVLRRASPLPSPPAQLAGATFDLTLPIQFKIR